MGYIDRFDGIKEVSVMEWVERSIEGVMGEEWVPGHRVVFFKRVVGKNTDIMGIGEEEDENVNGVDDEEYYNTTKPSPPNPTSNPFPSLSTPQPNPSTHNRTRNRKTKPEEPWDGTLTEDLPWETWHKRGVLPSVDIEGSGKIEGEIVWDRRRRIDLISDGGGK